MGARGDPGRRPVPADGRNWAARERYPTIHVAYLAPYAYQVFAEVDPAHPWTELVRGSYEILRFLYFDSGVVLPPERIWVDPRSGALLLEKPGAGAAPQVFGYDAVPIFWRVALDARWFGRRGEADLRARMLAFPREAFRAEGRLRERYTTGGRALSELDGQPHMASVAALAAVEDPALAAGLRREKLDALFERALAGEETPYYLHNWLWLGRALELGVARRYDEPLAFLLGIDWGPFRERFPLVPVLAALALVPLARRFTWARAALLALALAVSARYLGWRARETLNFVEPLGPAISLSLLAAEVYAFSTIVLLAVQVGVTRRRREPPSPLAPGEEVPSVDVFVPIYSESLEILDKTLAACMAMRYPSKTVHVCDDSHREAVARLAAEHGARYIAGPKRHAKAGNLNNALSLTQGDLVVVFDTDHVPSAAFLERTVPHFREPRMGVVQTPPPLPQPGRLPARLRHRPGRAERGGPLQPRDPGRPRSLGRRVLRRLGRGVPARGHRLGGRLQPALHHRGHPHEPEAPREGLALGVRGRGPRHGSLRREPAELPRPAAPLDARAACRSSSRTTRSSSAGSRCATASATSPRSGTSSSRSRGSRSS